MESQETLKAAVLVAEDDSALRKLVVELLRQEGYTVLTAKDGQNALSVARNYAGKIDLLITDVMMPKVDGFDLREKLLRERENVAILVMSGNLDPEISGEDFPIIRKPFSREAFLEKVKSSLAEAANPRRP